MDNGRAYPGAHATVEMTKAVFWATTLSLLFTPSIQIAAGMPSVRIDDALPFLWLLLVVLSGRGFRLSAASRWRALFLLLFLPLIPASILAGFAFNLDVSPADLMQMVRILKYVAVYLLAAEFFRIADKDETLARVSLLAIPLLALAFFQYFDIGALNARYVPIIAPTQFESLMPGYPTPRPVGMVGNPNEFAFMFALLGLAGLHQLLKRRAVFLAIALSCSMAGILITLSRGTAVAALGGGCVCLVAYLFLNAGRRERAKLLLLGSFTAVAASSLLFLPPIYDAATWRFVRILDMGSDSSWVARVENWSENLALFQLSPFVGVGPLRRAVFEHAADNDWLLIARSYGLLGVACFLAFLAAPVRRNMVPLALGLAVTGALYMIPTSLFHSLVLFPLFLILLASADVKPRRSPHSSATAHPDRFWPADHLASLGEAELYPNRRPTF